MRVVAVLALDNVVAFDLAVPGQIFGTANAVSPTPAYEIRIVAAGRRVRSETLFGAMDLHTDWDLDALADAHTVVVPGRTAFTDPDPRVLRALRAAHARGARIASVCTGTFTLAAAGLLDDRRATTHWRYAAELSNRYPRIDIDPAVLFVEDGRICTSAGVAAGLDMCLHLVRRDLGAAVAADTARFTVMPPQRRGGQAQFITHPDPGATDTALDDTLHWMTANLHRPLTLADIADHAALSIRSLNRHFRSQTGTTPLQWLLHARIRYARQLLETTDHSIETVARHAGFTTATAMRHHFTRHTGLAPLPYRANFRATHTAEPRRMLASPTRKRSR
ncbi:helix-turn-helix domain-containing protein [Nocardia sp. CDC153]|uniref:GlxA family transcriptional regulator n=1 Tax=Nocardia sp. CDC153 TaxID=3112167 RepID=UPI002DB620C9|nr:helix-turn-helix domain-containing protein [Nocardia sp. CDC153]MEC3953686.1 helix-turn-helix domain-containing protein [Nocardia sp. CDC153]